MFRQAALSCDSLLRISVNTTARRLTQVREQGERTWSRFLSAASGAELRVTETAVNILSHEHVWAYLSTVWAQSEANSRKEQQGSRWADEVRDGRRPVPSMGLEVALPHSRAVGVPEVCTWCGGGQGPLGIPLRKRATTRESCKARNPYTCGLRARSAWFGNGGGELCFPALFWVCP